MSRKMSALSVTNYWNIRLAVKVATKQEYCSFLRKLLEQISYYFPCVLLCLLFIYSSSLYLLIFSALLEIHLRKTHVPNWHSPARCAICRLSYANLLAMKLLCRSKQLLLLPISSSFPICSTLFSPFFFSCFRGTKRQSICLCSDSWLFPRILRSRKMRLDAECFSVSLYRFSFCFFSSGLRRSSVLSVVARHKTGSW